MNLWLRTFYDLYFSIVSIQVFETPERIFEMSLMIDYLVP